EGLAAVFVLPDAPAATPTSKPTKNVAAAIAVSFRVLWPFKAVFDGSVPGGGGGTALISPFWLPFSESLHLLTATARLMTALEALRRSMQLADTDGSVVIFMIALV